VRKSATLLVLTALFCARSFAQSAAGIIFINKDSVYDFGAIAEGETPAYQFQFKNTGSEPLSITGIKSESPDLKFKWPGKPVKPGKKGMIIVTYSPRDQSVTGSFKSDVLVTSNATANPYPFIHVSGTVVPAKGGSPSSAAPQQKSRGGRK